MFAKKRYAEKAQMFFFFLLNFFFLMNKSFIRPKHSKSTNTPENWIQATKKIVATKQNSLSQPQAGQQRLNQQQEHHSKQNSTQNKENSAEKLTEYSINQPNDQQHQTAICYQPTTELQKLTAKHLLQIHLNMENRTPSVEKQRTQADQKRLCQEPQPPNLKTGGTNHRYKQQNSNLQFHDPAAYTYCNLQPLINQKDYKT
jgi:Zn-dependent M16 (insulinase) family peptidase